MTDIPEGTVERPERRSTALWVLYWFDLVVLAFGGFYAALLVSFISVFGSVDRGWLTYLVMGGWLVSVVLAIAGGITAYRARRSPLRAVGYGALILLAVLILGFILGQLGDPGHGA